VAVGRARYFHRKPWNPITRLARGWTTERAVDLLASLQPESGGFLEAVPLTSFVVMGLASAGQAGDRVVRKGVEFLLASVRPDGSWPIAADLATWNTTLAVNALAGAGEDVRELNCVDWLLACQHRKAHPLCGSPPGGWARTDRAGMVPDVDGTSGALVALAAWLKANPALGEKIEPAAAAGVNWLLDLQNADGGWPTCARGWAKLPLDRSGSDLTAHALRALGAWRGALSSAHAPPAVAQPRAPDTLVDKPAAAPEGTRALLAHRAMLERRIASAIERGFRYLSAAQHADGCWMPLWFGDQYRAHQDNPVYGTSQVLAAYRDFERLESAAARRGLDWLAAAMHADGSWGGQAQTELGAKEGQLNVEQTALAVEALLSCGTTPGHAAAAGAGLKWLVDAVEANRHQECSPIGLHFGGLWYYEKLYPLVWTVAALGQASRKPLPRPETPAVVHGSPA
jgi:squalene-hopene/tetraprenyl-beta-curcumene cyclase